jgi:hypothetical protein
MKKLVYIALITLLFSCKEGRKDLYREYNGQMVKVKFDDSKTDSTFTGYGGEYYPSGNLKSLSYFKSGEPVDTLFYYYEDGTIKEKGLVKDNFSFGWWSYYDNSGNLTKKSEWLILKDSLYKNQSLYFDKKGEIKIEPSTYFELDIPDTLRIGKNLARIKNYTTNFNNRDSNLITVIIDNQYSEFEFKKDTFSDGTIKPFFGIYGYKIGEQVIKGKIEEKILTTTEINKDSSTLTIENHYKYFEKKVYVWNKDKYSESGLRIGKQMKKEYKNN